MRKTTSWISNLTRWYFGSARLNYQHQENLGSAENVKREVQANETFKDKDKMKKKSTSKSAIDTQETKIEKAANLEARQNKEVRKEE